MAWLETANRVYTNQVIDAHFRLDGLGGYCAAGIMFRIMEKGTYYLALVSNKGYFRFDAVNDKIPKTLIGWTEIANGDGAALEQVALGIVAKGEHLIFTLNGKWIAEVNDGSIPGGHMGFSLVSYDILSDNRALGNETSGDNNENQEPPIVDGHVCEAWLDYLSVDSSPGAVGKAHDRWSDGVEISGESRLCLADTFAALGDFEAAYNQILKAWKQREDAARSVMATYTDMRSGKELLFAARMASLLGRYDKAEKYINACLSAEVGDSADETEVLAEKTKILSALGKSAPDKFRELVAFLPDYIGDLEAKAESPTAPPIPPLYALLGHAQWNLKDYEAAAAAWSRAFDLNEGNGLYAENAAAAYDMLDQKDEALRYFLAGGNSFLRQADFEKLGVLVPKLLAVGQNSREALRLAGEWAKGIGDLDRAATEFALAEQIGLSAEQASEGDIAPAVEVTKEPVGKKTRAKTARIAEPTEGIATREAESENKSAGRARAKVAKVTGQTPEEAESKKTETKPTVSRARNKAVKVVEQPTEEAKPSKARAKTTKVAKQPTEEATPKKAEAKPIASKARAKTTKVTEQPTEEAAPKAKTTRAKKAPEASSAKTPKPAAKAEPKAKQDSPGKKPNAKPNPGPTQKAKQPASKTRKTAK